MKRIFTIAIMALMTLAMNAQVLTFEKFSPGNNPLIWSAGESIFLYAVDNRNEMEAVDGIRTFSDGMKFTTRLKTQGKSKKDSQVFIKLKKKGTLYLYLASANSDEPRNVGLVAGTEMLATCIVNNQNKTPLEVRIDKPCECQLLYPEGPINMYGLKFVPDPE